MDNFTPDSSQLKALATWYPVGHDLHLDPRHPCIKLAGEAGELLDLYGKEEYKPGFSWWDCIQCGARQDRLRQVNEWYGTPNKGCCGSGPVPKVLDELGDYSYYLRILAYIRQLSFEATCKEFSPKFWDFAGLDKLLALLNQESADILTQFMVTGKLDEHSITIPHATSLFLAILHKLDTPLPGLLELNYKKLNSEETNHGWKSAKRNTPTKSRT